MDMVLEVKDLCKTYIINKRQNNVLKNVNFTVGEGEMVAVMGASGSGKSTLLYSVSGMDNITAGEVKFLGKDISGMDENGLAKLRLDKMGFIFQSCNLVTELAVRENILLSKAIAKENVMELLKMLNGDYGITIVMITYDFAPAKMTTSMITISGGRINSAKGHLNKVFAD